MTRTAKKRRSKATVEPTPERALFSSLWGILATVALAIALMLIFSLLALFSEDPAIIARIGGYFSFYVSSMLGGFIAYRKCGGYTFLAGLFTGLGVFVLTALLSILIPSSETSMNVGLSILLRMICVAAAVGGAYLGAYRPSPRKRRRRK